MLKNALSSTRRAGRAVLRSANHFFASGGEATDSVLSHIRKAVVGRPQTALPARRVDESAFLSIDGEKIDVSASF